MKLIVNADDFGLTSGVTYGIYDAMCRGVVTSTTMMVNTSATLLAAQLAKREPALAVGLHVNISLGGPLTRCPSLLKDGMFQKPAVLGSDEGYDVGELDEELEAQYQRFVTLIGREPTHIDSHLYAHQKFSKVRDSLLRLAENHGVPVRQFACGMYPPIYFEGNFKVLPGEGRDGLMQKFTSLVGALPKKAIAELMVHPAFADEVLLQSSSYNLQRVQEHSVLTDPYAAQFLRAQGIELVSFKECKG